MSKLPWAPYVFGIWVVAIVLAFVVKYITAAPVVLVPLSVGLYWLFVRAFSRIKGYE